MYRLLHAVQRQTGVTVLHVTHNRGETRILADQVLYLRDGAIVVETAVKVTIVITWGRSNMPPACPRKKSSCRPPLSWNAAKAYPDVPIMP